MVEMTGAGNTWFAQCIETCATYPGCLDVSLSGAVSHAILQLSKAFGNTLTHILRLVI